MWFTIKAKVALSWVIIAAASIFLFCGLTLSWFTNEAITPDSFMTAGTVDYEITSVMLDPETVAWEPGECKNFTWNLKNTGTKSVYFRARLIETLSRGETAWGEGNPFPGANWAMYFTYDGNTKEVKLLAGQHYEAGWVEVGEDEQGFYVTYRAIGEWRIAESHLAVATKWEDIPQTVSGNPIPGQLPYKSEHGLVEEFTYRPQGIDLNESVYIAAHADMVALAETVSASGLNWALSSGTEGVWQQGSPEDLSGETVYWWYSCDRVLHGEDIGLNLTACLDEDAPAGVYTVQLEAEAVQASNNAPKELWAGWPCSQELME